MKKFNNGLLNTLFVTVISVFFIYFIVNIFYFNTQVSGYIHNGYFATYSSVSIRYVMLSIFGTISVFLVVRLLKLSPKVFIALFIATNAIFFILRIILVNSFNIVPAGDSIQIFISIADLMFKQIDTAFLKGGYISTYGQQLGFSLFLMPLVSFFQDKFALYYVVNAGLLQASMLLLSFAFMKKDHYKSLFWISLGLNLFIPNLFYQFILYSDPVALLFISLSLFAFMKFEFNHYAKILATISILSIAIVIRAYAIVPIIAMIVFLVLGFKKIEILKKLVFILMLIMTMFLPQKIVEFVFNSLYDTTIGEYSLPSITWLAIGLQGSGFTPEFINHFSSIDFNQSEMTEYLNNSIRVSSANLMHSEFWNNKISYAWTNQDFDAMSYIMPNQWGANLDDFYKDNSIRLGRASGDSAPTNDVGEWIYTYLFSIRNYEKVFLLMILELSMVSLILNIRKKDNNHLLLELVFIGFSLLFILLETQPRYLLVAINILIVYAFYAVSTMDFLDFNRINLKGIFKK